MDELERVLRKEYQHLSQIMQKAEKELQELESIQGKLRISSRGNQILYYHRLPNGKQNGEYLKKKQDLLAQKLAQKSYDEKVLKIAARRLKQVEKILNEYQPYEVERIYTEEHPARQELIEPIELTRKQRIEEWLQKSYQGKPFGENLPLILTNRGERVRSKSEKILADYFDQKKISYKYECPLFLKPYGIVYPDFTFLNPDTGEEIYWEHEGMMDRADYAINAIKKIELYEMNNIFPGEQLILTYETEKSVLSTRLLEMLSDKYLKNCMV